MSESTEKFTKIESTTSSLPQEFFLKFDGHRFGRGSSESEDLSPQERTLANYMRRAADCQINFSSRQQALDRVWQSAIAVNPADDQLAIITRDVLLKFWTWQAQQSTADQFRPPLMVARPLQSKFTENKIVTSDLVQLGFATLVDQYGQAPIKQRLKNSLHTSAITFTPKIQVLTRVFEQFTGAFQGDSQVQLRQQLQKIAGDDGLSLQKIEKRNKQEMGKNVFLLNAFAEHFGYLLLLTNSGLGFQMKESKSSLELALRAIKCEIKTFGDQIELYLPNQDAPKLTLSTKEFTALENLLQLTALRRFDVVARETKQRKRRINLKRAALVGLLGIVATGIYIGKNGFNLHSTPNRNDAALPHLATPTPKDFVSTQQNTPEENTHPNTQIPEETNTQREISTDELWDAYLASSPETQQLLERISDSTDTRDFMTKQADEVDGIQGCRINCVFQPPSKTSENYQKYLDFDTELQQRLASQDTFWEATVEPGMQSSPQVYEFWYRAGRRMKIEVTNTHGVIGVKITELGLSAEYLKDGQPILFDENGQPNMPNQPVNGDSKPIMLHFAFDQKTGMLQGLNPGGSVLNSAQYELGKNAYAMVGFEDTLFAGVLFEVADSKQVNVKVIVSK